MKPFNSTYESVAIKRKSDGDNTSAALEKAINTGVKVMFAATREKTIRVHHITFIHDFPLNSKSAKQMYSAYVISIVGRKSSSALFITVVPAAITSMPAIAKGRAFFLSSSFLYNIRNINSGSVMFTIISQICNNIYFLPSDCIHFSIRKLIMQLTIL